MDNKLRETIQNFLVDWDNTSMDEGFGLADYDLWMETAVNLLEQSLNDDEPGWNYSRPIVGLDHTGKPILFDSWNKNEN